MQILWAKNPRYFKMLIENAINETNRTTSEESIFSMANPVLETLQDEYDSAQSIYRARYQTINHSIHVSELIL
jgi:hypothetical protein